MKGRIWLLVPFILQFIPLEAEPEKTNLISNLFISTQVKQDDFNLNIDQLLFVKADGNYIELTRSNNHQIIYSLTKIFEVSKQYMEINSY